MATATGEIVLLPLHLFVRSIDRSMVCIRNGQRPPLVFWSIHFDIKLYTSSACVCAFVTVCTRLAGPLAFRAEQTGTALCSSILYCFIGFPPTRGRINGSICGSSSSLLWSLHEVQAAAKSSRKPPPALRACSGSS